MEKLDQVCQNYCKVLKFYIFRVFFKIKVTEKYNVLVVYGCSLQNPIEAVSNYPNATMNFLPLLEN